MLFNLCVVYPSPEQLARLIDSVPGVVWEARGRPDAPGQVIDYVSPGVERMLGYSVEEWLATPNFWLTIVHPDDREQAGAKALQDFNAGGGVNRFRWLTKAGRVLWVEAHATVIYDAGGLPVGMRGVTLDVSDRIRAEKSQQYLADAGKILSSSLDYEVTLQNLATLTVPEFADWFAVDLLKAEGKSVELAVLSHRDASKIALGHELRRRFPIDLTDPRLTSHPLISGQPEFYPLISDEVLQMYIDDAELLEIMRSLGLRSSINVPLVARERVLGSITFIMGESGRHYDEFDLQTATELAARASLAIDNARLFREARDAVRQRQDILSIVSHDLKNPLTAIELSSDMLQRKIGGQETAGRTIDAITKAVRRAVTLIDDLNEVSKIESGGFALAKGPSPLHELLGDLAAVFTPVAADRRVKLTITPPRDEALLFVDGNRLFQALSNVVANALKFAPAESEVSLLAEVTGGVFLCAVHDAGPGIRPEYLENIFKRNWQGDSASRLGSGLGLYIARAIVEAHQGRIRVDSQPGRETTFAIEIPNAVFTAGAL